MLVTPLYWYEVPGYRMLVAKLYFMPQNWTQYAWIAYEETDTPPPKGEPL
jgi:hypothetical protein